MRETLEYIYNKSFNLFNSITQFIYPQNETIYNSSSSRNNNDLHLNIIYEEPKKMAYNNNFNLCVLLCGNEYEENYYYVGAAVDINLFLKNEFDGNGSEWTKLHKPIKILFSVKLNYLIDLDDYVLKVINKNGINKVRGGSFNSIVLDNETINFIKYEIRRRTNKCIRCGKIHSLLDDGFLRCDLKNDINGDLITCEPINENSMIFKCDICISKHYNENDYKKCVEICSKRKEFFNNHPHTLIFASQMEPWLNRISLY